MRSRIVAARLGIALAAAGALAACGQRGALYLPEENGNVVVTPAQPAAPAAPADAPAASPATPANAAPATSTDSTEEQQRRNSTAPATTAPAK